MPPEEPTITGRAAIEKRYTNMFDELHNRFKDISHSLEVDEVRVCGDWAISRGRYRLEMTLLTVPRTIVITGKNMHTYRRQSGGSWLIASDIWNSDAPARRGPEQ
jgi:ketosteroid isomerase-like protein